MKGFKEIVSRQSLDKITKDIDSQIAKHRAIVMRYIKIKGTDNMYRAYVDINGDIEDLLHGFTFIGASQVGGLGKLIKHESKMRDPPVEIKVISPLEGDEYGLFVKGYTREDMPYLRRIK
jgi:hypothetical protein